jgi:2'-5' RNA ligase
MDKLLYIVAELDDDTQAKIKELEKIIFENGFIGKQTKDIPYHITLCSFTTDNENYLVNLLEKINGKFNVMNIKFSGLGLFGLNVLYINPYMNKELIELYNFVKEKSQNKDEDLAAHMTLFIDEPENVMKILPKIGEKFQGLDGKIKYISSYEFFPLRFIKKIELVV